MKIFLLNYTDAGDGENMAELLDFGCGIKTSLSKVNKNSDFFFFL